MHKIKRQANRNAWYEGEETQSFNPFSRTRRRTPLANVMVDEEQRHGHDAEIRRRRPEVESKHLSLEDLRRPGLAGRSTASLPAPHIQQRPAHGFLTPLEDLRPGLTARSTASLLVLQPEEKLIHSPQVNWAGVKAAPVDPNARCKRSPTSNLKSTVWRQIRNLVSASSYYPLLLFVPAGFAVNYTQQNVVSIFAVNFIATFPNTILISFAADELMGRTGNNIGALINATFSNAAQFIVSIFLLKSGQIILLQTTLIGTILSSMHLMLGLSFFFGGLSRIQQNFNVIIARVSSNLLLLAMVSIILPTMATKLAGISRDDAVDASRGISFILIVIYMVYLYFQLKTHNMIYEEPGQKAERRRPRVQKGDALKAMVKSGQMAGQPAHLQGLLDDDEAEFEPKLSLLFIAVVMIICTTLLTFNASFATDSLQGLMDQTGLSATFVGIVLLPLLSNDFTIVTYALKDEMDICVACTVGKCLQTILLVIPFSVLLGWIIHQPMSLNFDTFEVVALFASVLYINSMIQSGSSNYLDGVLLLGVFLIICLTSYWVPAPQV